MIRHALRGTLIPLLLSCTASPQLLNLPSSGNRFGNARGPLDAIQAEQLDFDAFTINSRNQDNTPLQSPSGSVSMLDLKAPGKARKEYERGYQLLLQKDLESAVQHLEKAVEIDPSFVAAHNALGTAYLDLSRWEAARDEFSRSVALDPHLPNSHLNLGIAQLALKEYAGAEESFGKASSLAPLDLQLSVALAYGELVNRDYSAVIATAYNVHRREHKGAELVHYFAAAAWNAQANLIEAKQELETLLQEAPNSSSVDKFREMLEQVNTEETKRTESKLHQQSVTFSFDTPSAISPGESSRDIRQFLQDAKERKQIAEAESGAVCLSCRNPVTDKSAVVNSNLRLKQADGNTTGFMMRKSVDEVDVFFAATDHGNSVVDLTPAEVEVQDDTRRPERVLGFRNESQLPLRLGIVLDTSGSVKERLSFEQRAATKFLQTVCNSNGDLGFVIGVNNSVLLVQDFTPDLTLMSHAIRQLAPGGGTALWDAVAFAADKLGSRPEAQPVARVLVVISDGEDNSSTVTLKGAIAGALRGEVVVYTVSTRELTNDVSSSLLGDHALRTLSDMTGGAAFVPGFLGRLDRSLADVEQVIRGRYLVSYKPAEFQSDGRYRSIEVRAQRNGHQLKVFARKGYYASGAQLQPAP